MTKWKTWTRKQVERIFKGSAPWQIDLIMIEPSFFISNVNITGKIQPNPGPNLLMGFGISVDKGWEPLLKTIITRAKQGRLGWEVHKTGKYPPGEDATWYGDSEFDLYKKNPFDELKFDQIKEKFGGLRVYVHGGTREFQDFVESVCEVSYHICEKCGAPGEFRKELPWMLTLCDLCLKIHLEAGGQL